MAVLFKLGTAEPWGAVKIFWGAVGRRGTARVPCNPWVPKDSIYTSLGEGRAKRIGWVKRTIGIHWKLSFLSEFV